MHAEEDAEEITRAGTRQRVLMAAKIRFPGGIGTVDCVIRNLSETGAKLKLSDSVTLPEHFELAVPQKNTLYRCLLRWRRGEEAGIAFLDAPAAAPEGSASRSSSGIETPGEEALRARVRMLEAEIVRLKARIAELGG